MKHQRGTWSPLRCPEELPLHEDLLRTAAVCGTVVALPALSLCNMCIFGTWQSALGTVYEAIQRLMNLPLQCHVLSSEPAVVLDSNYTSSRGVQREVYCSNSLWKSPHLCKNLSLSLSCVTVPDLPHAA